MVTLVKNCAPFNESGTALVEVQIYICECVQYTSNTSALHVQLLARIVIIKCKKVTILHEKDGDMHPEQVYSRAYSSAILLVVLVSEASEQPGTFPRHLCLLAQPCSTILSKKHVKCETGNHEFNSAKNIYFFCH